MSYIEGVQNLATMQKMPFVRRCLEVGSHVVVRSLCPLGAGEVASEFVPTLARQA